MRTDLVLDTWRQLVTDGLDARFFALVDPAVDPRVISLISEESLDNECLFGYPLDSDIARSTPRLVQIHHPEASPLLRWIAKRAPHQPVATLIAANATLSGLADHLKTCADAELEDLDSMFLAYWDPAILGTLVGQADDSTLNVSGPVLTHDQRAFLLRPILRWWYWDREGALHVAAPAPPASEIQSLQKLVLVPQQVDDLVEAAVPDHLLQHIRQNQPELLDKLPESARYRFVRQQLARARAYGLEGTGDLVNYVCVALAFGSEFDLRANMPELLLQVKNEQLGFPQALEKADEAALQASSSEPELLP